MNLNYTRLGVLLIRVHAVIAIAQAIPGIAMAIPALSQISELAGAGLPNYALTILLQPVIGVLLFVFSVPIAQRAVGFLDQNK